MQFCNIDPSVKLLLVLEVLLWLLAQAAGGSLGSDVSLILSKHLKTDVELLHPEEGWRLSKRKAPAAMG